MSDNFFEKEWNAIVTIGTSCECAAITKLADKRYFSSPFDNIETSTSLIECSALISRKFKGYMDSVEDWKLKSCGAKNNRSVRCGIKEDGLDFSQILFPHIYREWFPGFTRNDWRQFNKWASEDTAWDHNKAWERFKTTMHRRQQRLVSLLESENKILFLRIDASPLQNIFPNNQQHHCDTFVSDIETTYPNADFGFYYLYSELRYGVPRQQNPFASSSDKMYLEKQGLDTSTPKNEFREKMIEKLEKIKLLPLDNILPYSTEYEKDIFYM